MDREWRSPRLARALAGAGLAMALFGGVATAQQATSATAEVKDLNGSTIGVVTFVPGVGVVQVTGQLRGLPPGLHGTHLHEVGRCEAPFASAGGHWNPTGRQHGLDNPQGAHVGDLAVGTPLAEGSNLRVGADGTAALRAVARGATLAAGPAAVLDGDGNSLVIHAGQDDNVTDPAGNTGERIACGVIVARTQALPRTGGAGAAPVLAGGGSALLALAGLALRGRRRLSLQGRV